MRISTVVQLVLLSLLVVAALLAFRQASERSVPQPIYPAPGGRAEWNAYDDRDRGGRSRCEISSSADTLIARTVTDTAVGAYWGIEWGPGTEGNSASRLWTWGPGDSLVFQWRARSAVRQRLFLCSHDPTMTGAAPLSRRYLTTEIPVTRSWGRSSISLETFEPPTWWLALHPHLENPEKRFLDRILVLQIGPSGGTQAGREDTLEISAIERIPNPAASRGWRILGTLLLVAATFISLREWRRGMRIRDERLSEERLKLDGEVRGARCAGALAMPAHENGLRGSDVEEIGGLQCQTSSPGPGRISAPAGDALRRPRIEWMVEPTPLDAPQPDLARLIGHLASNYQRESLDLATVAQEIGLSPRRVTALLSDRGESFKGALNGLRLLEARRLLIETDLQVAEIAFKVGYGNVSHFNRIFRERFGRPPGGIRGEMRNPPSLSEKPQTEHGAKD